MHIIISTKKYIYLHKTSYLPTLQYVIFSYLIISYILQPNSVINLILIFGILFVYMFLGYYSILHCSYIFEYRMNTTVVKLFT